MFREIFSPIQDHLDKAEEVFHSVARLKVLSLDHLARLYCSPPELVLRSALIILSAGMFGPVTYRIYRLATLFQLVFVASSLHRNITAAKEKDQAIQFPILAGDYFYSKSFTILLEEGLERYLQVLSGLIAQINENSVLRLLYPRDPGVLEKFVSSDQAGLLAWGCRISGEVNGAGETEAVNLYQYGFSLGMAAGLQKEEILAEKVSACFEKARRALSQLPEGTSRNILAKLVDYIASAKEGGENEPFCNIQK
ncbi:MAG: hypothetical protein ACUVSK_00085 [Desulfotomaculales bacterium]